MKKALPKKETKKMGSKRKKESY